MKARHYRKSCDGFRRRESMNAQTPASGRAAGALGPLPTSDVEGTPVCRATTGSPWDAPIVCSEGVTRDRCRHHQERRPSSSDHLRPRSLSMAERDISEQLVDILMNIATGSKDDEPQAEELADAFRDAAELPPITKQSLSELDIQNIISNIKLRHDVNFDRELSFRPNNEGPKGQQKERHSRKYWLALQAEFHLYTRLFQGSPPLKSSGKVDASVYFQHAQRRVPKMFEAIYEILKSLVPDRDHERVDEHLDVRMLMQKIEKGVCDMVALVEWTARLLKEHCAPMRDQWVDDMVRSMRQGAALANSTKLNESLSKIVESLRGLLAMLEVMKLDVANHQIRNLKPLLIEDTVNYERHYHLDRIVNHRARVNIDTAQKWWASMVLDLRPQYPSAAKDTSRSRLEMFSQAVVSCLFPTNRRGELPDTFYLDHDRMRVLKLEIEDLVHFELCFTLFHQLLKEFGYHGTVSNATKHHLRASLSAVIGECVGHSSQAWMYNSESISLEIYRQARLISGQPPVFNHSIMQNTNDRLRTLFHNAYASHATVLEDSLLSLVLGCVKKHYTSSPTELYNSLVALPPSASTPSFIPLPSSIDTFSFSNNTPRDRLNDLSKRISHIVLLHWRIWAPIAYVQDDTLPTAAHPPESPSATSPEHSHNVPPPPPPSPTGVDQDVLVVNMMKKGDPPDPGSEHESSVSEGNQLP